MNGKSSVPLQRAVRSLATSKERVGEGWCGARGAAIMLECGFYMFPFTSVCLNLACFNAVFSDCHNSCKEWSCFPIPQGHIHKCHTYQILSRFGCQKNICLRTCHSSKCDWKREQHVTSNKLVKKNIDPLQKFKLLVGHMWSRVYPILKQVRFEIPWDSVCQVNRLQPKTFISLSFVVNRSTDIQKGKADGHLAQKKLWFLVVIL